MRTVAETRAYDRERARIFNEKAAQIIVMAKDFSAEEIWSLKGTLERMAMARTLAINQAADRKD